MVTRTMDGMSSRWLRHFGDSLDFVEAIDVNVHFNALGNDLNISNVNGHYSSDLNGNA
jgi:hypothetical protein